MPLNDESIEEGRLVQWKIYLARLPGTGMDRSGCALGTAAQAC